MTLMNKQQDYLENCRWCLEQAKAADAGPERIMLIHIAETWKRLAQCQFRNRIYEIRAIAPRRSFQRIEAAMRGKPEGKSA